MAVHLHGKRKKVAKVYMALVSHIDNEDVHLRYMAKSGSMYCLSDETNSIDTIANMKKNLADVNNNSPTTKIIISTVITREDRKDMKKKVNALNSSLKAFCESNSIVEWSRYQGQPHCFLLS